MMLQKIKVIYIILVLLVISNIIVVRNYVAVQNKLVAQNAQLEKVNFNSRVLDFTSLFIQKVLKAKGEVSFEDRLKLETVVRGLNDAEILAQWNKFVNSKNEAEAQDEVKNLLDLLVKKVRK